MQALVSCRGDDDIRPRGGRKLSDLGDAGIFLSLAPRVDVFFPPLKRTRVSAPFIPQGWEMLGSRCKQMCSLNALSDECLLEILKRVDGDRERSVAACVSKRWLTLLGTTNISMVPLTAPPSSKSGALCGEQQQPKKRLPDLNETAKDEIDEDEEEEPIPLENCDKRPSRCLEGKAATDVRLLALAIGTGGQGGVGELSIRADGSSRRVTDVGLGAVARSSPSLRVLSLWNTPYITDKGLSQIANRCPLLEKLDLSRCPQITDKGISAIAMNCARLSSLTIESCPMVGNDCLWAVGHFCPKLRSVSLTDLALVGDKGVGSLLSSSSSSLRKISLRRLSITDLSLALIFADLPNVTERGLWVMGCARGLQQLKSLTIISSGATDLGLEAVAKGCPLLKQLSLQRCTHLSDSGLRKLSAAAASLEILQLEECNLITLPGVAGALLTFSARFRSLSLVRCLGFRDHSSVPGFGNSGLAFVGKLCRQLRRISLSVLPGGCKLGLVKVNLGGCVNVTDAAVAALAKRHGGTLQALDLGGCTMVTDESLLAISDSCFLLQDVDVSKSAITDAGVAALASGVGLNLRILSVSGCPDISARSLVHLSNLCPSLVGLNLQLCDLLTGHDIASFQSKMGQCDVLS
ncbi:unnamed protein product [Spirodela intermedia]|uniref:F-box/LRR-repeat protein 15-like leucin rich repeat domain-containing protein n=1 Tax=Spirodela intermedia TaxID=51605 RepID=A0A7I8JRB1_SPIIN|nr:unnamed protein product [Spirodela intermedia]CAA6672659.1 unnamed protein product [Spirodela intermedia]